MLEKPKSMSECRYFTNRSTDEGKVKVWVFKADCPQCNAVRAMSKPVDPKTGKPKMRATEYVCVKCGHVMPKQEVDDTLSANIEYTCACGHSGEKQIPFKRKKTKGVEALVFECESCGQKIYITKKMKKLKK